jgi:K+-sensing histidine kinase KdpD
MHPESTSNRAFWLQVDLFPAEPDRSWIIRLRDVTKQVNLQRDMRGFHEVVSHKLLTPILGMQVSLEMLARHAADLSTEEVIELASKGLKNVERLESQIRDVLQYLNVGALARAETGFEVGRLAQVATDISMTLELKKVTVSGVEALREARLTLSAQAVELVLREVLENAKKFHPHQSPAVEISIKQDNAKEVCLTISDDGLILSPEQLTQAWKPYYQGEKDFTGEVSGMGLGLSMVASLIWGAGGTGRLYNREEGPGVVVELMLPLAEKLPEI